jgi:hypothetical protein
VAFMQRQITQKSKWFQVETSQGTDFIPADIAGTNPAIEDLTDYCEGIPVSFEVIEGYGARLSAPGYMDCTEWTVFETEKEAQDYLEEMYPEDEEEEN